MSATFWIRRKKIAAQIREQQKLDKQEPVKETVKETEQEAKTTAKKSTKKAVKTNVDEGTN